MREKLGSVLLGSEVVDYFDAEDLFVGFIRSGLTFALGAVYDVPPDLFAVVRHGEGGPVTVRPRRAGDLAGFGLLVRWREGATLTGIDDPGGRGGLLTRLRRAEDRKLRAWSSGGRTLNHGPGDLFVDT